MPSRAIPFQALVVCLIALVACRREAAPVKEDVTPQVSVTRLQERVALHLAQAPKDPELAALGPGRPPSLQSEGHAVLEMLNDRIEPRFAVESRSGLRRAHVSLPKQADLPFHISDESGVAIDVKLAGASNSLSSIEGGFLVQPSALPGIDLIQQPMLEGVEDFLWVDHPARKREVVYEISLGNSIAGLRLVENTLEFLEASGTPRLRVNPPYLIDATGRSHAVTLSVLDCAVDTSPAGPWGRPVTSPGSNRCHVKLSWGELPATSFPLLIDPAWTTTGSMTIARIQHGAVQLMSGQVLVSGGYTSSAYTTSANLYDPGSGAWSVTGSMNDARVRHTLNELPDWRVIAIAGNASGSASALASAELYVPSSGTWTRTTGSLSTARFAHSSVVLSTGQVVVTGGTGTGGTSLSSVERFEPLTGTFSTLSSMLNARARHQAILLPGDKVLAISGYGASSVSITASEILSGSSWASTGSLGTSRHYFSATTLLDGTVFVYGGVTASGTSTDSWEIYNPASGLWSLSGTTGTAVYGVSSTRVPDGRVLLTGGSTSSGGIRTNIIFNPSGRTTTTNNQMSFARYHHSATSLEDGRVLVAGGYDAATTAIAAAEVVNLLTSCTQNSECTSGFCADGYCCNTACNNGCDQCNVTGSEGTCTVISSGSTGSNPSCAPYLCNGSTASCPSSCSIDTQCTSGNFCNGSACVTKLEKGSSCVRGLQCQSGNCINGFCCDSACSNACDVCSFALGASSDGTCSVAPDNSTPSPACGAYLCNGVSTGCPTSCSTDADCTNPGYCSGGVCLSGKTQGSTCSANRQCASGNCVDGFCCNSACAGSCDVCSTSLGATANGTCTILASTSTGPGNVCSPYRCNGSPSNACGVTCSSDARCATGFYCDAANACQPQKSVGASCSRSTECAAGNCVDGFCCSSACAGGCDVCSAALGATSNGTCTVLGPSNTPPVCGNYLCTGFSATCPTNCQSDSACTSSTYCTGAVCVSRLAKGSSCTRNQQCQSGNCVDGFCCDSACSGSCDVCSTALGATANGTCTVLPATSAGPGNVCAPFRCEGSLNTCLSSCDTDAQCASGYYCTSAKTCAPVKAKGIACARAGECGTGFCSDGVCCNLACDGSCNVCTKAAGSAADGTCSTLPVGAVGVPSCAPFACSGTDLCPTLCGSDLNCDSAHYCVGGQCVLRKTLGESCAAARECATGNCADGYCCNSACGGSCDVCSAALGATSNGRCTVAALNSPGSPTCAPNRCDGISTVCATKCTSDANCSANAFCNSNGVCTYKLSPGDTCNRPAECASGFCADGVCCNTACDGECDRCNGPNAKGTCLSSPAQTAGDPSCGNYLCSGTSSTCPASCANDALCTANAYCSAGRTCLPRQAEGALCSRDTECASGHCADGYCCDAACSGSCDVCSKLRGASRNGACTVLPAGSVGDVSCAPYVCDGQGALCPSTCSANTDCTSSNYCANGTCRPKESNGKVCKASTDCESGFCVDGVCCNSSCSDQCAACNMPNREGTCSPVTGQPVGNRPTCESDGTVCGGSCNGFTTRNCAFPQSSTTCGPTTCTSSTNTPPPTCDNAGHCKANQPVECAPYQCSAGIGCLTRCAQDPDCVGGYFCQRGTCLPLRAMGEACSRDTECTTGSCVDGFCCDSPCAGACARCNAPNREGLCTAQTGGTPDEASDCAPLLCNGVNLGCPEICVNNSDCANGYACVGGACVKRHEPGHTCTTAAECASGFCADGFCCNSSCLGSCATCAAPGQEGVCTLVAGAAAPGRQPCSGEGVCGGSCNGTSPVCAYPEKETECAPAFCSNAMATAAGTCDGSGACQPGEQQACISGCAGDHCAPAPATKAGGCASTEPTAIGGLLALMLAWHRLRRRRMSGAPA
jgi:hypothetical protein